MTDTAVVRQPPTPLFGPEELSYPNAPCRELNETKSAENPFSSIYSLSPKDFKTLHNSCDVRDEIWETSNEKIACLVSAFESKLQIADGTCQTCQDIFNRWQTCVNRWPRHTIFPHHSNLYFLESSSRKGCRLCRLFLQSFDNRGSRDKFEFRKSLGIQISPIHCTRRSLRVEFEAKNPEDPLTDGWNVVLRVPPIPNKIRSKTIHSAQSRDFADEVYGVVSGGVTGELMELGHGSRSVPEVALCERYSRALLLARQWLNKCLGSHKKCRAIKHGAAALPNRLIFLGDEKIALWQRPKSFKSCLVYATLSHCWGGLDILRLQKHNMTDFEEEIPYSALCKTFQDAIYIARQMRIQYLWIDSLCIIQDDENDWEKESALMCDVYSGSHLNIAAASASDGTEGCFFVPDSDLVLRHQLKVTVGGNPCLFDLTDYKLYERVILSGSLANRAWAYQERALAPRVLYFGKDQVFWECEEEDHCEVWPSVMPSKFYGYTPRTKSKSTRNSTWDLIMTGYSKCQMTLSKDKLVALSGVVQNLQRASGDKYLAGLWRKDLEWELTWSVITGCISKRPVTYRAPTWTWASLDGQVEPSRLPRRISQVCVQVLHAHVELKGSNPFGEVSGGTLVLRCEKLFKIVFENNKWICGKTILTHYNLYFSWDYMDNFINCFLLPTIKGDELIEIDNNELLPSRFYGLILIQAEKYSGKYERVGMFEAYIPKLCGTLREAMTDCKGSTLTASYMQNDAWTTPGENHHVIHIC